VLFNIAAALLPVLTFLTILFLMDSFKLVRYGTVAVAVGAGAASALAALAFQTGFGEAAHVSFQVLTRVVAPLSEETLKAIFIVYALRKRRLGFLVDAAIVGFSVGTGFALVENLEYLRWSTDSRIILWIVRGFGPAILHGTTTAVFAMLAKGLSERHPDRTAWTLLAAWSVAVLIHSAYNQFLLPPLLTTLVLLVVLPLLVTFIFERSERAARQWVGEGLDLDVELLNQVTSPSFGVSRLGTYLHELKSRFPGPVVADMFCLLRIELELAIRAKGMLMARHAGLELPVDPSLKAKLQEWRFLQGSIGRTGLLALKPLRATGARDDWQRNLLEQVGGMTRAQMLRARARAIIRRTD
jgi:RsiW-degrading membrane proteinase PrsW (M82 family)